MSTNQQSDSVNGQRSGGSLPDMYIGLTNQYGDVITSSNNAKLTISIAYTAESSESAYPPILTGTT